MRIKTGKARPKYLGTLIFLLLFFLNEVFPNAAVAFTSLNACARSKECLELIKGSSSSAVSAPTGAGFGSSTLSTTTSGGAVRTLVKGVTDFAIVTGPTAAYVGWHYWNEAHNGQAQNRVVSQKQGSGKVEKLKTPTRLSHVCSCPIQMATLSA